MCIVTSKEFAKAIKVDNYGVAGTFIAWFDEHIKNYYD